MSGERLQDHWSSGFRFVAGSLVFGVLYDKLNKLMMLASFTFLFAVFQCVTPWCSPFPLMIVANFLSRAFAGGLDTGIIIMRYI